MNDEDLYVSLVIPIYNAGTFLRRCLDSVKQQTYKNFECILVDDGSTDESGMICDDYAFEDKRFRVIHSSNKGVSHARNAGIKEANGRYIVFIDSDDVVSPSYLNNLLVIDSRCDLVLSGIRFVNFDGEEIKTSNFISFYDKDFSIDQLKKMISTKMINTACAKRFKKDIIRQFQLSFDSRYNLAEDTLFVSRYLSCIHSVCSIQEIDYLYYNNEINSLSSFDITYVNRLYRINQEIANILECNFQGISQTKEWDRRICSVFEDAIFYVLTEKDFNDKDKLLFLSQIMKSPEYKEVSISSSFMENEGAFLKAIVGINSPLCLIWFWKMNKLRLRGKNALN